MKLRVRIRPYSCSVVSVCLVVAAACDPGSEHLPEYRAVAAIAEPTIPWAPEHYVAYRIDDEIAIDGELRESSWKAASWTSDFVDIEGPGQSKPRFRTRAKVLWDTTYLYLASEMEEPHVWGTLTERDAVIYRDNDFEVFIDPNADTHEYYELEINALGTEWDLFLVRPYRDGGPAIHGWDMSGLKTAVHVDGTLNDPSDTDEGWGVEIAIPWGALSEAAHRNTPPSDGDQWRLNFSRVEWRVEIRGGRYEKIEEPAAGRTRPEDNWVWSPQGVIAMHYPEMWGIVQFSSRLVGTGVDDFIPRLEDEARWLLRRVYYREHRWLAEHATFSADISELGVCADGLDLLIFVTPNLFDASVILGERELHIGRDGRVW